MSEVNTKYILSKIRQEISIADYLESKNIHPVRTMSNGCALYLCPIHGDTDPSMRVWPDGSGKYPYENYKCFGCKSGNDIVALYADLEFNGNWGQAIQHLANKVDCSIEGSVDYLLDEIKREYDRESGEYYEDSMECFYLKINDLVKNYIDLVEHDKEEEEFAEGIYKVVDSYLWSYDLDSLKKAYKFLSEDSNNRKFAGQSALKVRYLSWLKKQENIKREKFKNA